VELTSGNFQRTTNAAILQTVGTSTSDLTMVDNNSNTYTIGFTQTGKNVDTGTTSATFLPDTTMLAVTDTMTVSGPFGSDISNSFTEGPAGAPVPEPSTWAMMLLGFAGLGSAGFRSRPTARLA
jgi:hypothetical protein